MPSAFGCESAANVHLHNSISFEHSNTHTFDEVYFELAVDHVCRVFLCDSVFPSLKSQRLQEFAAISPVIFFFLLSNALNCADKNLSQHHRCSAYIDWHWCQFHWFNSTVLRSKVNAVLSWFMWLTGMSRNDFIIPASNAITILIWLAHKKSNGLWLWPIERSQRDFFERERTLSLVSLKLYWECCQRRQMHLYVYLAKRVISHCS